MPEANCDILVIGAGPAGLACAAEAAARGLTTVLLERNPRHPVHATPPVGVTPEAVHGRLDGPAAVTGEAPGAEPRRWRADRIVLATGDVPSLPKGVPAEGEGFVAADDPVPDPPPPTVLVAGGGPAGVAAALRWRAARARVVLVTRAPRLLPRLDADLADHLTRRLEMAEVDVRPGARLVSARPEGAGALAELRGPAAAAESHAAGRVVLATGRRAATDDLGLDSLPVVRDRRGRLQTDPTGETAVPGLYAVGGAAASPVTARSAAAAGRAAAAAAAGVPAPPVVWDLLPRILPAPLQSAAVGLSEDEAQARGHDVAAGCAAVGEIFAKLVADRETGRLLGLFSTGPEAERHAEAGAALLAAGAEAAVWERLAPADRALAGALEVLRGEVARG